MWIKLIRQRSMQFLITILTLTMFCSLSIGQEAAEEGGEALAEGLSVVIPRLSVNATDIKAFLNLLAKPANMSFLTTAAVKGQVTVQLNDVTVKEVLDLVLPQYDLAYEIKGNVVNVMTKAEWDAIHPTIIELINKTFKPQYTRVENLQAALSGVRSKDGKLIVDKSSQQIIVTDTPEVIAEMEALINSLDVEQTTRIFHIKYADVQEIQKQLAGVISADKGNLQVDIERNIIIITDVPENIEKAAKIIAEFDIEREVEIFDINFADPKDLQSLIKGYLTKEGKIDYDERTSKLVVEDIPSRIEKVRKIVAGLDEPHREIYIEAEILKLNVNDENKLGVEWQIGSGVTSDVTQTGVTSRFPYYLLNGNTGFTFEDIVDGDFRVYVNAMLTSSIADILASPRLLVRNDSEAKMQVGSEEPFAVRSVNSYNTNTSNDIYTQRSKDVGIILEVKPHITSNGYVDMEIVLEDSSAAQVNLGSITGLRVDKTEAETTITVKDGRTAIIGGMIKNDRSRSHTSVPLLGKIPLLKFIFGSTSYQDIKTKLVLFITPHIINLDNPYDYMHKYQEDETEGESGFISTSPFNWDYPEYESPSGVYILGDEPDVAIPIESIPGLMLESEPMVESATGEVF